jgi:hypothetical protein
MSRRKSEIAAYMNERDFPHLVELELPAGGFRDKSQELESFHRERGIAWRRPTLPRLFPLFSCALSISL